MQRRRKEDNNVMASGGRVNKGNGRIVMVVRWALII
jgi:hypothetical protein